MTQMLITEAVRHQVRGMMRRFGAGDDSQLRESILIKDGFFCGRRFQIDGLTAVWFVEESELKFYDREGNLLDVAEPDRLQREAA